MILNPVIQGGGAEKVYKITNHSTNFQFQESASPGDFVISKNIATAYSISIRTEKYDNYVPNADTSGIEEPTTRLVPECKRFFVMPNDNVVITDG